MQTTIEKMEIDVDQLLFELVKEQNMSAYTYYQLRCFVVMLMSKNKAERTEIYQQIEAETGLKLLK